MNNNKLKNNYKNKTKLILSGMDKSSKNSFVNPPIEKGSTVTFNSVEEMNKTMIQKHNQILSYGRFGSKTTFKFEKAISNIEGAHTTVATSSGTAAIVSSLLSTLKNGDHLLMTDSAYGVSKNLASNLLKKMGITTTFYDPLIGNNISKLITKNTKVIYLESPGSLTFEIQEIPQIVNIAKKNKCTTIIDNTWATPLYFKPFKYGVDISIQAATKYINGHSDSMLGTISSNKKYAKIIRQISHSLGACPGPEDIYLGLRGLKSLKIRLEEHQRNAIKIIDWLAKQKEVEKILYPAFPEYDGYKIWKRDFLGATGLFGIVLKPISINKINKMIKNLKLFNLGYSWGGYESLILPVQPKKYRETYNWNEKFNILRIHAGLEDADDLIEDLKISFKHLRKN